ncbi:hypothetical protein [Rhodopila sp.]|uniref:hypothetical protein n=1 Tax=Rhodopila sp. TaxID=2480087 RepID=UPI003D14B1CB
MTQDKFEKALQFLKSKNEWRMYTGGHADTVLESLQIASRCAGQTDGEAVAWQVTIDAEVVHTGDSKEYADELVDRYTSATQPVIIRPLYTQSPAPAKPDLEALLGQVLEGWRLDFLRQYLDEDTFACCFYRRNDGKIDQIRGTGPTHTPQSPPRWMGCGVVRDGMPDWYLTKDGDASCLAMYERHYSAYQYKDGRVRKLFCGPGEKIVLRTRAAEAIFVWRKFIDASGQTGINCAVFRNEGPIRSSDLIRQADEIADFCWPGQRHYTYVRASAVRSANPGFCFISAGWNPCGATKSGLRILERIKP